MNGHDQEIGHVYLDPDASRRFGAFLRRTLAVLSLVLVLGAFGMAVFASGDESEFERQRMKDDEQRALAFAAVTGLAPPSAVPSLIQAAGLEAVLIHEDGTPEWMGLSGQTADEPTMTWRDDVLERGRRGQARSFTTVDPSGQRWQHSVVPTLQTGTLITSEPIPANEAPRTNPLLLLVALTVLGLALIGILGLLLFKRVVQPSLVLLDASEDIRVRGEVRAEVRDKLSTISTTPAELSRIGNVLLEIEAESQRGFRQIEALLRSASALGGSLDERTVLDASLEHLEHLLGIDRAGIVRYDARHNTYEVLAVRGHTPEWLEDMVGSPVQGSQPSLLAMRAGEPHQVIDTEASFVPASVRNRARRFGYRSILAVPLIDGLDRPITLVLQNDEPRSYSFDEIELSKSFASIASAAVRNAELFARTDEKLRLQTSRLEAIVESVEHGLLVVGEGDEVLYANTLMRRLCGGATAAAVPEHAGEFVAEVLRSGGLGEADRFALQALQPDNDSWVDLELRLGTGEHGQTYRVRKFVVRDKQGHEIGRGSTWTDITRDRELERMKSGLLAAVSHEFRTPLALIKGYTTTLLADDVAWNEDDQAQFLTMVSSEADRLTDLVQRILDMRRIDAGMISLELMPVDFDVVIESMLSGLPQHRERIHVHEFDPVAVDVDAARITTVLRNLVENACKYSAVDQPVEVSICQDGGQLHVSVRDYGRGVEPAFRDRIFDTFVRGERGQGSEVEGVGLGLAISKGFVEAHDGTMWLRPPEHGPGSVFGFTLPRADRLVPSR